MILNDFADKKLSALGMGMMRLPVIDGQNSVVDEAAAAEMVDYCLKNGVNYFDTAWGYHEGNSEIVVGKILSKYPRDSYYLASKFPGFNLANMEKVEEIFEKQLEKCKVDYFDFYLFHNVCEGNIDAYLDEKYGVFKYLLKQKRNGRIKHLGLSVHGNRDTLKRFLDAYGAEIEFCQVQINYLDILFSDTKAKLDLLDELNIPVWVMEPVRGGRLATLSDDATEKLKKLRPDESVPGWAFRFLQTMPSVKMILSGMSNLQQVKENIETFSTSKPLNKEELEILESIAEEIVKLAGVPCTACRYCVTECPQSLNIPELLKYYNQQFYAKAGALAVKAMPENKRPEACIGCRSCEAVCPQNIKISEAMADFVTMLNQ